MKESIRKKQKKEEIKNEDPESKAFDPAQLFISNQVSGISGKYKNLYEEQDQSPFVKLLEAINMRASDLPLQSQFPKMDLTALYCLGFTIQEYARHLSTNILTQKLASENAPQLNTLFTQEELDAKSFAAIIDKYKEKKPVKSVTPAIVNPRPDIRQEVSSHARSIKYHQGDPFSVDTVHGDTFYQKMLRTTDWENVLRKDKDPEAAAAAAQLKREKDEKRQAKRIQKSLRREEKRQTVNVHIPPPPPTPVKEEYAPPTPPADIFDNRSKSIKSTSRKKPSSTKRKRAADSFF